MVKYVEERSMKFSTFLGRVQVMLQIYKQENEEFQDYGVVWVCELMKTDNFFVLPLQWQNTF
jgi:hypothetical protein